jgi:hypothetical protein
MARDVVVGEATKGANAMLGTTDLAAVDVH